MKRSIEIALCFLLSIFLSPASGKDPPIIALVGGTLLNGHESPPLHHAAVVRSFPDARIELILSPESRFHYDVRSAQGFQSENSRWHLLQLLDHETAQVEIRWPSGRVTNHSVTAGDRTVIYERVD